MREALPIMNKNSAVRLLLFPMIGKFDGTPVRDVAVFTFSKDSIEHSCRAEQANMAAVKRSQRPAAHTALFAQQNPAGLAVSRRCWQKVFYLIEGYASVGQNDGLRARHVISPF